MCSPFPRYLRLSATSLRAERISPDASTISRPTAARAATATIRSRAADTVTVTATASVTATVTVMDTEAILDRMTKTVEANKQNISAFGSFVNRRLISYLFGTPCGNISFSKSPALFWYCASDIAPCWSRVSSIFIWRSYRSSLSPPFLCGSTLMPEHLLSSAHRSQTARARLRACPLPRAARACRSRATCSRIFQRSCRTKFRRNPRGRYSGALWS